MTLELAFRRADNGTSQYPLTSYRKSNDDGVSLLACQRQYISVPTYSLQKVESAGVSLPTCQQQYISVSTYLLQKIQ